MLPLTPLVCLQQRLKGLHWDCTFPCHCHLSWEKQRVWNTAGVDWTPCKTCSLGPKHRLGIMLNFQVAPTQFLWVQPAHLMWPPGHSLRRNHYPQSPTSWHLAPQLLLTQAGIDIWVKWRWVGFLWGMWIWDKETELDNNHGTGTETGPGASQHCDV